MNVSDIHIIFPNYTSEGNLEKKNVINSNFDCYNLVKKKEIFKNITNHTKIII